MNSAAARLAALTSLAASRMELPRQTAPAPRTLHLDIVRDEAGFHALAPIWDGLLACSAVSTPFLTWDWVSLWWEEYRGEFELAIGVARDETGAPLAIAPLVIGRPAQGARRHLRHLTFFGGIGDIISEGMDFLVSAGMEHALTPVLCEVFARLRGDWDVAHLFMMHEESPNLPHVLAALTGAGIVERQASRFIALPKSWEDIELSHGNNWRSNHRRKWRKMLAQHAGRALSSRGDLPAEHAFNALLDLHSQRWSADESLFLRDRAKRFHRKLARRWLPENRLEISLLELDGKPGAGAYCFVHGGRAWFYQSGWNAQYSAISIGKLAISWAVQCAIERGLSDFDFLPGEFSYKREWSNAQRRVVTIEAFSPFSPRAAIFRLLRFCKRRITATPSPRSVSSENDSSE